MTPESSSLSRRSFLRSSALASTVGLGGFGALDSFGSTGTTKLHLKGKAEHCIFLWLGGGAAQMDTFDPKKRGDAKAKKAGSYYDAIDTAVPGVQVCEHLPRVAHVLDRITLCRTVFHNVIDEHAAAAYQVHTGRPVSGTIQYPSLGSVVAHEKGQLAKGAPKYVVIGYPSLSRNSGFLGANAGYLYLLDVESGPAGLARPANVASSRWKRRENLLGVLRKGYLSRNPKDRRIQDYDATLQDSLELAGPKFMSTFELAGESPDLRESYGGEFGQRCLLARRLVQRGVRFIEVSHNLNFLNGTGWDTHNQGQLNQHLLIKELDNALATLITDLEKHSLLDKTLVAVGTEFGRPAGFDGGGGRGHHSKCFSLLLAGGGLNHQGAYGVSDELAQKPIENPVSLADFHATVHAALGIDPSKELHAGDRPVPITDRGKPIAKLFG
ncbi:uncharacterized protein METZ01_LOCUS234529 [marine metagenome]|uniref:Uncharacterized protein n=1 Tax=marine metagenome TaxID=408172 RepID=A0A382H3H3_9ZZZZ